MIVDRFDSTHVAFGPIPDEAAAATRMVGLIEAIHRLRQANEDLARNPNEELLLLNLFWQLPAL